MIIVTTLVLPINQGKFLFMMSKIPEIVYFTGNLVISYSNLEQGIIEYTLRKSQMARLNYTQLSTR